MATNTGLNPDSDSDDTPAIPEGTLSAILAELVAQRAILEEIATNTSA